MPTDCPTGGPMSVLDRDALDASPLADLHAIASELSIDGYRRLRRAALIDAILERQGGEETPREKAPREKASRAKAPREKASRAKAPREKAPREAPSEEAPGEELA